jgi:hypothetical protein
VLEKNVTDSPTQEKGNVCFSNSYFVRDLVFTLLAAVFTGVAGSILLILLVFGWGHAVADNHPQSRVELQLQCPTMRYMGLTWHVPGEIDIEPRRLPDLYLSQPLMIALKGKHLQGSLAVEGRRQPLWQWRNRCSGHGTKI